VFKDYYSVLEISVSANQAENKIAYKTLAIKWHPDKNIGFDTTTKKRVCYLAFVSNFNQPNF
jgi:DnaJ-class molecular chaperone